ncbi:hypothetical protein MYX04_12550, partial [Nitrospiraceae bacterium AH_259_D15_M11_P09]|nr:hypothetical protein [Nitrospiraceae bacterium AH_259_D15_M11_P09]
GDEPCDYICQEAVPPVRYETKFHVPRGLPGSKEGLILTPCRRGSGEQGGSGSVDPSAPIRLIGRETVFLVWEIQCLFGLRVAPAAAPTNTGKQIGAL